MLTWRLRFAFMAVAARSFANARPCDIYADAGTPCVAAHSTTRALYNQYSGPLYQVRRSSDDALTDINLVSVGGVANAEWQDEFCNRTTCVITTIYDQSGHGNHLRQAPPGGAADGPEQNGYDFLASAVGAPVTLKGEKAYGVFSSPGTGYRNDIPNGTATGDGAQGMYALFDGSHYNTGCCFDYGNAERDNTDPGNGFMEAIYFGTGDGSGRGTGAGTGPWIMADLENGLFSGKDALHNEANPSMNSRFVTAIVKGEPNHWAIRGGDGAQGSLATFYDGVRPDGGYNPMQKEGAILLGVGGDNSNSAQGTFYEGVMTQGYPSDEAENRVQDDIVAAGYAAGSLNSGPGVGAVGSRISLRVTTACCTTQYMTQQDGGRVGTEDVAGASDEGLRRRASWIVRAALGGSNECYSFESVASPGSFIRHFNYELRADAFDGSKLMAEDATFCTEAGLNGQGTAIRSWSYPARYWRHYKALGFIASNGGPFEFDNKASFSDDVSYVISNSFA